MSNQKVNKLSVRWAVNDAVREALHRAVTGAVYEAVPEAVPEAVWRSLSFSAQRAAGFWGRNLHEAGFSDLPHPALQDFLRPLEKDGVGCK